MRSPIVAASLAACLTLGALPVSASLTFEAQDWWDGDVGGNCPDFIGHPGRHIHMEVTVPSDSASGTVVVPWRVRSHDNFCGKLDWVKWQDDDGGAAQTIVQQFDLSLDPDIDITGTFAIDTTKEKDGWRQWRFYAKVVQADGNAQVARPIIPVYVDNGTADSNASNTWIQMTSWYNEAGGTDWGYLQAQLKRVSLPTGPISGVWKPIIKIGKNSPAGAPPVTGYKVHLDPNFHNGDDGTIIASGNATGTYTLSIDTSTLSPGDHRLVVRTIQEAADGRHHEAVGVFHFTVA